MKAYSLRHYFNIFALLSFLIPTLTGSFCKAVDAGELNSILDNFLTVTRDPSKKFPIFALALIKLLKDDPAYKNFCKDLQNNMYKSGSELEALFLGYKDKKDTLPAEIAEKLTKPANLIKLRTALYKRAATK